MIVVLSVMSVCQSAESATDDGTDWQDVAANVVRTNVSLLMKQHKVPGVSVAIVADGGLFWTGAYGVASAESKKPVDTNTLFEAASMSKPLFAYAVLKLVEEKKLKLDQPLVAYLEKPYLPKEPEHRLITARMVMNHTTGFPNWRSGGWLGGKPLTLKFKPGSRYGYSGEGFLYLQRVVEHLTREPLQPFIGKRLLRPLGMKRSSYRWETRNADAIAAGHDGKGLVKRKGRRYMQANAAYSLFTTSAEYALFLIEMMKPDRSAGHSLRPRTLADMLKPAVEADSGRHFGLGWWSVPHQGRRLYSHGGSNGSGHRCVSQFDPQEKTGIVIMCNAVGGKPLYQELLRRIDDALSIP